MDVCTKVITSRIDNYDQDLINHLAEWYGDKELAKNEEFVDSIQHHPKMLHYKIKEALELYPKKPEPETSSEVVLFLCGIFVVLLCAAIYHMR